MNLLIILFGFCHRFNGRCSFNVQRVICCFRLNDNRGKQQFELMLKQLVQSIGGMMLYTSDRTVRAQVHSLITVSLFLITVSLFLITVSLFKAIQTWQTAINHGICFAKRFK